MHPPSQQGAGGGNNGIDPDDLRRELAKGIEEKVVEVVGKATARARSKAGGASGFGLFAAGLAMTGQRGVLCVL